MKRHRLHQWQVQQQPWPFLRDFSAIRICHDLAGLCTVAFERDLLLNFLSPESDNR